MFCNNCGRKIPVQSKICPYCGKPVVRNVKAGRNDNEANNGTAKRPTATNNSIVTNEQPNIRSLNNKQKRRLYTTIIALVVVAVAVLWIFNLNSTQFVNLQHTMPGKTWEEEVDGKKITNAKFLSNGRTANNTIDGKSPNVIPSAQIKLERHTLIFYALGSTERGEDELRLVSRHGNKYHFKFVQVTEAVYSMTHTFGRDYNYQVHVERPQHRVILTDGPFHKLVVDRNYTTDVTHRNILTHGSNYQPSNGEYQMMRDGITLVKK